MKYLCLCLSLPTVITSPSSLDPACPQHPGYGKDDGENSNDVEYKFTRKLSIYTITPASNTKAIITTTEDASIPLTTILSSDPHVILTERLRKEDEAFFWYLLALVDRLCPAHHYYCKYCV